MPMPGLVFDANYWSDSSQGYTRYAPDIWPDGDPLAFGAQADTTIGKALAKGFPIDGRKVLIAGCAAGYTIERLVVAGVDAYGLDISGHIVGQSPVPARIVVGDALTRAALNETKALAGLRANQRADLLVTEDLLPCLTDTEITAGLVEWRRHAAQVLHRVSVGDYEGGYNLKTLEEWRSTVGQSDWLYEYGSWQEG
jgi:hypothetical protein